MHHEKVPRLWVCDDDVARAYRAGAADQAGQGENVSITLT